MPQGSSATTWPRGDPAHAHLEVYPSYRPLLTSPKVHSYRLGTGTCPTPGEGGHE